MRNSGRFVRILKVMAVALALTLPAVAMMSHADARAGGGFSSGSRGARTWSVPPSTNTAPRSAQPFSRTATPNIPGPTPYSGSGWFGRPSLLGGLATGFLGAGLFGLLFGGSLFGGLGGFSSLLGLLLQVALIVFLVRLALGWWRRRNLAFAGPASFDAGPKPSSDGFGFGLGGGRAVPIEITQRDYDTFERLLSDIQAAWSHEDAAALSRLTTPEMQSYFARDLQANRARGVINEVSGVRLLQGDLSEAWREGNRDYATVAMRFSLIDRMVDRSSGHMVGGTDLVETVTEVWTFVRTPGSDWVLSAIQQS